MGSSGSLRAVVAAFHHLVPSVKGGIKLFNND